MGCRERGYIISVFSTEEDRKKGSKMYRNLYEYGMDGAILASLCRGKNPAAAQVLRCADGYAAQKLQEFGWGCWRMNGRCVQADGASDRIGSSEDCAHLRRVVFAFGTQAV